MLILLVITGLIVGEKKVGLFKLNILELYKLRPKLFSCHDSYLIFIRLYTV